MFLYLHVSSWCMSMCSTGQFIIQFSAFQGGKGFELSFPLNAGPESAERAVIPGDTVSPLSNVELPTAAVAPSTSMVGNASILASLRMVN